MSEANEKKIPSEKTNEPKKVQHRRRAKESHSSDVVKVDNSQIDSTVEKEIKPIVQSNEKTGVYAFQCGKFCSK